MRRVDVSDRGLELDTRARRNFGDRLEASACFGEALLEVGDSLVRLPLGRFLRLEGRGRLEAALLELATLVFVERALFRRNCQILLEAL